MPNYHYDAHINSAETWTWGEKTPPDANKSGDYGRKQRPILQRGDTIVLRLGEKKGLHTIELIAKQPTEPAKLPFAYPYDLHKFTYDPDKDILTCAGLEGRLDNAVWKLIIGLVGEVPIDPEFQVGPGGITDGGIDLENNG
jgi:hypothetical protein